MGSPIEWLGHRVRADVVLRQPGGVTRDAVAGDVDQERDPRGAGRSTGCHLTYRAQFRFLQDCYSIGKSGSRLRSTSPHYQAPVGRLGAHLPRGRTLPRLHATQKR